MRSSLRPLARACLAALLSAAALAPARAAEVTDVATAMDERHPLQLDLDVTYRHLRRDTRVTREHLQADAQGNKAIILVDELAHAQTLDDLLFRVDVGLWHDLELHILAPFSLRDQQTWDYASGTNATNSTLQNNTIGVSGCLQSGSCQTVSPILARLPGQSIRGGFRDPTVGVAWGVANEAREQRLQPELFPAGHPISSWVVGFDYTLPLPGSVDDPSKLGNAAPGPRGSELKKAHVFSLYTAFSKRFSVADPYLVLRASAPLVVKSGAPGDGSYDDCWHPEKLSNVATANCADPNWKGRTGYQPAYEADLTFGTELVFSEDTVAATKVALDLRGGIHYTSAQRGYTQVADALGKLTYADEYITGSTSIGLYARAGSHFRARASALFAVDTAHFLTTEATGRDLDGNGSVTLSNGVSQASEQNPLYDFRIDQVGRRLRAEAALTWGLSGSLEFVF